ncbi:hypothetical protein ABGB18_18980 [Nonomuraea sp. B12E4]|uniref:hypothetical protein n=1 Tax=Nonomuraea sp. B12E4 TaxID=3153564 RepID=UPI00325DA6BB
MAFFGILFMIQGFGGLIARFVFKADFGLLHRFLDGGTPTAASAAMGIVGLAMPAYGIRAENRA